MFVITTAVEFESEAVMDIHSPLEGIAPKACGSWSHVLPFCLISFPGIEFTSDAADAGKTHPAPPGPQALNPFIIDTAIGAR